MLSDAGGVASLVSAPAGKTGAMAFDPGDGMPDASGIAVERLRSFVERIERMEDDRANLAADRDSARIGHALR